MTEKKQKLVSEMTMRDLFAGLAMAGMLARSEDSGRPSPAFFVAKEQNAVAMADRLIAALERPPMTAQPTAQEGETPQK
jgi:hypothetical protein